MEKVNQLPPLNEGEVIQNILSSGEYKADNVVIKEWPSYKDPKLKEFKDSLLSGEIKANGSVYTGLLNQHMERDYVGIQKLENGDIYLGQWENNKKTGMGVYLYNRDQVDGRQRIEMFLGKFIDGVKDKEGVYVWIEEKIGNEDLLQSNFEAYTGELSDIGYKRGIYLTKIEKNFYIYYGNYVDGKKTDDKCYFYDNNGEIDRVFRGKINQNTPKEGFFITFFKEEIDDSVFLKFGSDGIPNEVSTKEMLGEKLVNDINQEAFNFREILYEEDWFGMIYETCKEAYKTIKNHKYDDFNNDKGFNQIAKVLSSYKNISLYPKLCVKMAK